MITKYNIEMNNKSIISNLDRITNQIFKLLPSREEGGDWESPLNNLIVEVLGLSNLFDNEPDFQNILSRLSFKLEGMLSLKEKEDFAIFRTSIFECIGLTQGAKKCLL